MLCETQSVSSRIWTRITVSISNDDNNYTTGTSVDKGVHTFSKSDCPKVNVIARVEYELAYYDSAVYRFNHYTTRTYKIKIFEIEQIITLNLYTLFTFSDDCPYLCRHVYPRAIIHCSMCPRGYMAQWIKALVRSSDIPKECVFNNWWRQRRTFRGEINRR